MLLYDYSYVALFMAAGAFFVIAGFVTSWLMRKTKYEPLKYNTYECGEKTEGPSWLQFNIRFYLIALLFVVFDIEVIFLVPWAIVFKSFGAAGAIEMAVFIAVLFIGFIYAWKEGLFEWR